MIVPLFRATVNAGILNFQDKAGFAQHVRGLEGKLVEVIVKKYTVKRSSPQNRYFHGVVLPMITDAMGEQNQDYVKDALKWHFLRKTLPGGLETVRATSELNTEEFTDFIEKCRHLAAEMYGIDIPDPSKYTEVESISS